MCGAPYTTAFLADLEVAHAGGPFYSEPSAEKIAYHAHELRIRARKDTAKRALLALPFAARLNRRFHWFDPPRPRYEPTLPEAD